MGTVSKTDIPAIQSRSPSPDRKLHVGDLHFRPVRNSNFEAVAPRPSDDCASREQETGNDNSAAILWSRSYQPPTLTGLACGTEGLNSECEMNGLPKASSLAEALLTCTLPFGCYSRRARPRPARLWRPGIPFWRIGVLYKLLLSLIVK
ncbi:hypothetical protein EVAR_89105_1 [Eumeta japonica]|uniref:Uncharacterized protein n=1 Tax=Eumeta variegata TaxID=151549 RepID=A0A4C1XHQ9_EUMVA|nr:hypothetical protein EVAR_89105_1 [Eumeta japonica]